jgi:hypothetical protein
VSRGGRAVLAVGFENLRGLGRGLRGGIAALILSAAFAQGGSAQPAGAQEPRITLTFNDVAAADAITQFRWLAEVPVVFTPPPAAARVTLSMLNVPLADALTALCQQMKYEWTKTGAMYVLTPAQRQPLLPGAADIVDRVLYRERQRLDGARLMLTLTRSQVARVSQGDSLKYSELSHPQQALLAGIYGRLVAGARRGWVQGAQGLASAPTTPPDSLAFSIRGYVWRVEQGQQPQPPPAGSVRAQPPPGEAPQPGAEQPSPTPAPQETPAPHEAPTPQE